MRPLRFILAIACLLPVLAASAETKEQRRDMRHEVRVGWGDMLFETIAFPDTPHRTWPNQGPATDVYIDQINHRYTGHIFAEYQYRLLPWLGLGAQVDFEGIFWTDIQRSAYRDYEPEWRSRNYNLVFLPTVRFTYLHHEWVNLYSGIGLGFNTAFDNAGAVEVAPAFNLNLFAVSVGHEHWFGTFELGMLNALLHSSRVYMLGSRLMSVSIGYRF